MSLFLRTLSIHLNIRQLFTTKYYNGETDDDEEEEKIVVKQISPAGISVYAHYCHTALANMEWNGL